MISAQRVTRGRILHHGTLLFNADPSMVAGALNVDPEKFRSKSAKSVRSRIGNIQDFLKQDMDLPAFWAYLKTALAGSGLEQTTLTAEGLEEVQKLKGSKYDTWDWNFGRSPKYNMTNKRYWDGGGLEVQADVADGVITDIVFYGDFLAVRGMEDVTDALRGCPFRAEDFAAVLDKFPLDQFFGAITKEEVLETVFHVN